MGGYDDWLRQRQPPADGTDRAKPTSRAKPKRERPRKLSFKEKHELECLPARIETLETELAGLHEKISDPDFYRAAGAEVAEVNARLAELEQELAAQYNRWQELDALGD